MQKHYDVVIMGGGLAGLALSIQLKKQRPDTSILVLERRETQAAIAAHKVGESTVELGSHYLRHVLGLKNYLETKELPKHGLRFFFRSHNKADITTRVELGPRKLLTVPSHQLDRGTLENHMAKHSRAMGNEVVFGAIVKDVEFGEEQHTVFYKLNNQMHTVLCRWVADATGRVSVLKRKLEFQRPMEHHPNAAWWRLKGVIDIDQWSDDNEWKSKLEPGLRYLSTVHFMDKGYWLWIIPLGSGNTSIGIVADPAVHPLDTFNSYEKAMKWLEVNEPLGYKMLSKETHNLMDFLVLKHYAHHTGRVYSADQRWGVTGEAGAFLDPFYSPGTDFISMNNTWLSDLIQRSLDGEDIDLRAKVYEQAHLAMVDNWIPIYQNKYLLMGSSQIMTVKILWDWAVYWAVPCLLFTNKSFTNLKLLKELFANERGIGRRFGALSKRLQDLFLDWLPHENQIFEKRYVDPYDMLFMRRFQQGIEDKYPPDELLAKVEDNMKILEQVAVAIFRLVSAQVNGTSLDIKVDPYKISLRDSSCITENGIAPSDEITEDVSLMWFYEMAEAV